MNIITTGDHRPDAPSARSMPGPGGILRKRDTGVANQMAATIRTGVQRIQASADRSMSTVFTRLKFAR